MTLMSQLTDDQLALAGCGGALLAAFLVMTVSYHLGVLVRRTGSQTAEPGTCNTVPGVRTDGAALSQRTDRRAA